MEVKLERSIDSPGPIEMVSLPSIDETSENAHQGNVSLLRCGVSPTVWSNEATCTSVGNGVPVD